MFLLVAAVVKCTVVTGNRHLRQILPHTLSANGYPRLHQQWRREANLDTKRERAAEQAAEQRNDTRSNHYASGI